MADILPLPGDACRHHAGGRCLYEEHLNPGYCSTWRCRAMARWESAFDEFLVRAERFDLGPEQAAILWERRFARIVRSLDCDRYVAGGGAELPACIHMRDGLCRLALPPCQGRCRHFLLVRPKRPVSPSEDPA